MQTTVVTAFAAGVALGSALAFVALRERRRASANAANLKKLRGKNELIDSNTGVFFNGADAPAWLRGLFSDSTQRRVLLREWEDVEWRRRAGWKGTDLIHDPNGLGVQVLAYFWAHESLTLTGIVRFGPAAESHRGLCHGGAMTSLMDDLCGHICFFAHQGPWCGATVQVNCKLMKPVRVGDVHKIVGKIDRQETKEKGGSKSIKVFISAQLVGENGAVFVSLEGLSITPVAMNTLEDAVSRRTWLTGGGAMRDSGWLL